MFQTKYPKFNTGRILKKEMLEALKNYPLKLVETVCEQYQDGIIDGFDIVHGKRVFLIQLSIQL